MLLIQRVFGLDLVERTENLDSATETDSQIPDYLDLEVTNPNCEGIALRNLPFMAKSGIVFSRLLRNGKVTTHRTAGHARTSQTRFSWWSAFGCSLP